MSDQFNQSGSGGGGFEATYESVLLHGDKDTAKASAKTKAKRIERSKAAVSLTMPGSAAVVAGAVIVLSGFRKGMDGRYKVISVRHALSRSGWTTAVECELA